MTREAIQGKATSPQTMSPARPAEATPNTPNFGASTIATTMVSNELASDQYVIFRCWLEANNDQIAVFHPEDNMIWIMKKVISVG